MDLPNVFVPLHPQILNQIKINNLDINNLNIEKNPLLTKIYEISALPTLILFRDGEIIWQKTGLVTESEINSAVGSFIQVLNC